MRYLIVDDEYIAHEIIQGYCKRLPDMELASNCYDALEAFQYLSQHQVDLIFLDLNMPELKGFDFLKTLSNPPKVIVTTAYKEFALEGYELNVVDYLLKPFSFERFLKAIGKVKEQMTAPQVKPAVENTSVSPEGKRVFLHTDKKYIQVSVDKILYLEAAGNYTKVIMLEEELIVRDKISALLELLPQNLLIQVHKSFAVAPKHINSIEGNQIFIRQQAIPIGRVYKLNVMSLLK